MKNTNTIVDVQNDKSFYTLHQNLQNFSPEATTLIKTASVDYDQLEQLPTTAFAWPEMRKFAMHTKEHTALSMIYAHEQDVPAVVHGALEKAASLYNIELKELPVEKTASLKTSFDSNDYLIPEKGLCKIASSDDIELGVEFLKRNQKYMDVMASAHANKVLYKKASALKVELPAHINQEAGMTMCKIATLTEWLETRAYVAKETKHKEAFTKLAQVLVDEHRELNSREVMLKVATTIAILDVEAGLSDKYHKSLATPMQTVFNSTKLAEETIYFGGKMLPLSSFMKLSPEQYSDVLGDDSIGEITDESGALDENKLRDILPTIPADLQMALLSSIE